MSLLGTLDPFVLGVEIGAAIAGSSLDCRPSCAEHERICGIIALHIHWYQRDAQWWCHSTLTYHLNCQITRSVLWRCYIPKPSYAVLHLCFCVWHTCQSDLIGHAKILLWSVSERNYRVNTRPSPLVLAMPNLNRNCRTSPKMQWNATPTAKDPCWSLDLRGWSHASIKHLHKAGHHCR